MKIVAIFCIVITMLASCSNFRKGVRSANLNDYDSAVYWFTLAIDHDPNWKEAIYNRGYIYFWQYNPEKAIDDFNSVLDLDKKYDPALYFRGWSYYMKGDYVNAIADFSFALKKYDHWWIRYSLPARSHEQEKYSLSIDLNLYISRGRSYSKIGEYELAVADFSEVLGKSWTYEVPVSLYNDRALAYYHLRNYDYAIKDFTEVIKQKGKDTTASDYYNRGISYFYGGNYTLAVDDFNKSLQIDEAYNDSSNMLQMALDIISGTDGDNSSVE